MYERPINRDAIRLARRCVLRRRNTCIRRCRCHRRTALGRDDWATQVLPFRRIALLRAPAFTACYVSREPWIVVVAEVAQGFPEIYCPSMLMLDQRGQNLCALIEKRSADLHDQPARNSLAPVFGSHRQAIDITPPAVPTANYGTNDPTVDRRDEEQCARFAYQTS